jgi:transcriptional regulator with XRE-family HTH domain
MAKREGLRRSGRGLPIVYFRCEAHEMDDRACRVALLRRQVDRKAADSMQGLADELGISRSTASRWFRGQPGSLPMTLRMLDKLGLRFDEVFRLLGPDENPNGTL